MELIITRYLPPDLCLYRRFVFIIILFSPFVISSYKSIIIHPTYEKKKGLQEIFPLFFSFYYYKFFQLHNPGKFKP